MRFSKIFAVLTLVTAGMALAAGPARACAFYYPYTCPSAGDYDSGDGWAGDYGYDPYYYAHQYDDPGPAILAGIILGGAVGYGAGYGYYGPGAGVVINNNVGGGFSRGFHHGFHHFSRFDRHRFDHHDFDHRHGHDHHGFDHRHGFDRQGFNRHRDFHHHDFHHAGFQHGPHHGMGMHHPVFHGHR